MVARVGIIYSESAEALRNHLKKLKASLTNLEKRTSPS